jgi:hypothetical protein
MTRPIIQAFTEEGLLYPLSDLKICVTGKQLMPCETGGKSTHSSCDSGESRPAPGGELKTWGIDAFLGVLTPQKGKPALTQNDGVELAFADTHALLIDLGHKVIAESPMIK